MQSQSSVWQKRHWGAVALAMTAAVNALWIISREFTDTVNLSDITIIVDPNWGFIRMKVRIALALGIGAIALCYGRLKGLAISCAALAWVVIEYLMWWYKSFIVAKNAEEYGFSKLGHIAYLHDAAWWDIWIIAITIALLIYGLKLMKQRSQLLR